MTVVRLGAWCDVITETEEEYRERLLNDGWPPDKVVGFVEVARRQITFVIHEFAELADGRRLTLHQERGFTIATREPVPTGWRLPTSKLERSVRLSVLPDDEGTQDEHPWEWFAELLRGHGVEVSAEELRHLPYDLEYSERLRARLVPDA